VRPDSADLLRWTAGSALGLGALFAVVSALRATEAGVALGDAWEPVAALALIGATVGGLLGPLLRAVAARRGTPRKGR
jgi:hypothetical protein